MVKCMKNKYEVFNICLITIFIIIILEIFFIILLFKLNIKTYKVFNGVSVKDNLIQVIVDDNDLRIFRSNKYIFYNDHKYKFYIEDITKNIINKKHLLLIKTNNKKKVNDIYTFSIYYKKKKLFYIFDLIWKE